ncbi:MAG: CopG family transcriptional regulator [Dehalococcoidia bacterium]
MVRKQVYISASQDAALKRHARTRRVSESELIRQGIDQVTDSASEEGQQDWSWEDLIAFARRRATIKHPSQESERGWTREELYDERLDRFSR